MNNPVDEYFHTSVESYLTWHEGTCQEWFCKLLGEKNKLGECGRDRIFIAFMKICTDRVKDCELPLWSSDLKKLSKLKLYSNFIDSSSEELCSSLPLPKILRVDLARFQTTSHKLEIEIGRLNNVAPEDRLCKLCARENILAVEDEFHVLFHYVACTESRHLFFDC
jgi:hypothetical protein